MDALRLATETTPEFILFSRKQDALVIGQRSLTRHICTGKMAMEYLDKTSHLEKQVIVCRTEHGGSLQVGDPMLVNWLTSLNYPMFYLDEVVTVTDAGITGKVRKDVYSTNHCHKILASSDFNIRMVCDLQGPEGSVSLETAALMFPEHLYITKEMIEEAGFKILEDNGQYVKALEKPGNSRVGVRRTLAMNREGSKLGLKTDGDTRTVFNGTVETAEDFFTIVKCSY